MACTVNKKGLKYFLITTFKSANINIKYETMFQHGDDDDALEPLWHAPISMAKVNMYLSFIHACYTKHKYNINKTTLNFFSLTC
jgi:hypothetical protein